MPSPYCEQAVSDALRVGRALLKFISPNDAGATGAHQSGFYLPTGAWKMFTPHPPQRGENQKHEVEIIWQDGRKTDSVVTWYGKAKSEYRLTRFGHEFPFLNTDSVGDLLVLIPVTLNEFRAYVLDLEEDIDDLQASLGVEVIETWGVYEYGREHIENEGECIDRHFREFAAAVDGFPTGDVFSEATRTALIDCITDFASKPGDDRLMKAIEAEYTLFRIVERRLCEPQIQRLFESVEDFLKTASSIMNRRKSRAGRSFENHMSYILTDAGVPFDVRPAIDGRPDIVIPGAAAYHDSSYPVERLFVVGLKTTCKDRWRQVLNEGKRVPRKHLITLQRGISSNQLGEMVAANVSLIVPVGLHRLYPAEHSMELLGIEAFIDEVKRIATT
jgi:EcoRII C terminal/Restriction endonuclease EcoRII, N-terminal